MTSVHIIRSRTSNLRYDHREHTHAVYTITCHAYSFTSRNFGSFRRMLDIIRSDDPHTEIDMSIESDTDIIIWTGSINDLIIGGQS